MKEKTLKGKLIEEVLYDTLHAVPFLTVTETQLLVENRLKKFLNFDVKVGEFTSLDNSIIQGELSYESDSEIIINHCTITPSGATFE